MKTMMLYALLLTASLSSLLEAGGCNNETEVALTREYVYVDNYVQRFKFWGEDEYRKLETVKVYLSEVVAFPDKNIQAGDMTLADVKLTGGRWIRVLAEDLPKLKK